MKLLFKNISIIITTVLVLFLSVGIHVSKMKCDKGGSVFVGTEVPSCSEENEVICAKEQEKVTCCMIEIQKSCCPETQDKSCASETKNLQFDFETLLTVFNLDFSSVNVLLYTLVTCDKTSIYTIQINHLSGIPPPKLYKPVLAKIQSFLL
ncbi:MAG: hypothetical protein P8P67_01765 [Flavobacteriales bacterium]|nr:hypothetical protein [Flavobacteriales bacterium]